MSHWYGGMSHDTERSPVQVESAIRDAVRSNEKPTLPMGVLRLAHFEYVRQGHHQTLERINERGGFGLLEVVALLADALYRVLLHETETRVPAAESRERSE